MNSIEALKAYLKTSFKGDIDDSEAALDQMSRDASLLTVRPKLVLFPKDSADIQAVVAYVKDNKAAFPDLSVTVRSAGTCMSGGPLNDSVILDVTRYMHGILNLTKEEATVLPGTFYRDFEPESLKIGALLPCYTASKNLNTIGGMVGNNSAGEKTLRYGKMENFVKELKVVFEDGKEYLVKPLSKAELDKKIAQKDFEGGVYKKVWDIVSKNAAQLADANRRSLKIPQAIIFGTSGTGLRSILRGSSSARRARLAS
jgi:FAD/FMN-containing dehydrogenase